MGQTEWSGRRRTCSYEEKDGDEKKTIEHGWPLLDMSRAVDEHERPHLKLQQSSQLERRLAVVSVVSRLLDGRRTKQAWQDGNRRREPWLRRRQGQAGEERQPWTDTEPDLGVVGSVVRLWCFQKVPWNLERQPVNTGRLMLIVSAGGGKVAFWTEAPAFDFVSTMEFPSAPQNPANACLQEPEQQHFGSR